MAKIIYNDCFGLFGLSEAARERYCSLTGRTIAKYPDTDDYRADPALVQVIEELGKKANGSGAELMIRDIPEGTRYRIHEYDGSERIITFDEQDWLTA
jgi:hypothetical protein